MRRAMFFALVLGAASLSCSGQGSPTAAAPNSRLDVFVFWDGVGQTGRLLEVLELGLSQQTDSAGTATFGLPAGTYTLRAHVNTGGAAFRRDIPVILRTGETVHVDVWDCVPCMSPN